MNALKNIQKDIDEQKIEIRKNGENVTQQVTLNLNKILEEKFSKWDGKQKELEEKVENQEKRIHFLEKQARQRNIVFFGIEEKETSYQNLQNNMVDFIQEFFTLNIEPRDIQEIKRIGKRGDRPRPIIVTFTTLGTRISIFKQKSVLRDTPYYLKEDYPPQVLEKRRELQKQAKLEKEKGNIVKIKYDKIVIIKPSNKRLLSISPIDNSQKQSETSAQATKKNKTLKTHPLVRRSSSVSDGALKPSMLNFLTNKNTINTPSMQEIEKRDADL